MLAWRRRYQHWRTGAWASTIAALWPLCTSEERRPSQTFLDSYSNGQGTGGLTVFQGVTEGPGPLEALESVARSGVAGGDLDTELRAALGRAETMDIAVSGGIDAWLLAALLRNEGRPVRGWYLESGVPGYCEKEQVVRMADALAVPCEFVQTGAADFLQALPEFVPTTESPIYNLHPVSKLLLAKAVAARGVTTLISGDGADQVMGWDWHCDLLPLTLTCFQAAGVRLETPFLSEGVAAFCREPRANKEPIRELARRYGVPDVPKRATLFPTPPGIDVAAHTTELLIDYLQSGRVQ